jgi:hypothetical protein
MKKLWSRLKKLFTPKPLAWNFKGLGIKPMSIEAARRKLFDLPPVKKKKSKLIRIHLIFKS